MFFHALHKLFWEVVYTKEREPCLRISPEDRLVPLYDNVCIRKFSVAQRGEMGWRVVDDCAEEHIQ